MGHPATEPPAEQEGKRPSDADLLECLTSTGARRRCAEPSILQAVESTIGHWPGGPLVRVVDSVDIDRPEGGLLGLSRPLGPLVAWLLQRQATADLRRLNTR